MSSQPKPKPGFDPNAYITVHQRIALFYSKFADGRIITHIVEHDAERGFVIIRAEAYRHPDDAQPSATGHAYEYKDVGYVQKTSYLEVAETSAVGRALAMMGFEVTRGIASREDMQRHEDKQADGRTLHYPSLDVTEAPPRAPQPQQAASETITREQWRFESVTPKQGGAIRAIANSKRVVADDIAQKMFGCVVDNLDKHQASEMIKHLNELEV